MSHDRARLLDQKVIWRYGLEPIMVILYSAKFDGHGYCSSGNMVFCHVIKEDHVIKGSWFYRWESLLVSHHPAKFGGYGHCNSGDMVKSDNG